MVRGVDVIVSDIADVGVRFYPYINMLLYSVEDYTHYHKLHVVLDRFNPLIGIAFEGGALQSDGHRFIGNDNMPIRYGLTAGEFANMLHKEQRFGCD